jgi:hypothetical protein
MPTQNPIDRTAIPPVKAYWDLCWIPDESGGVSYEGASKRKASASSRFRALMWRSIGSD